MHTRPLLTGIATTALVVGVVMPAQASVAIDATLPCAQPDGRVSAMVISGRTVYLGGTFTHVKNLRGDPQPRAHLAAVNADTCELLSWRADTDGDVYALEAANGVVYAGGDFLRVGGLVRSRLAALDATSAGVRAFDGGADKPVRALETVAGTLFAGGDFTRAQGATRSRLAAFDTASGVVRGDWKPSASSGVLTMARSSDGQELYVGGNFTTIGGAAKPYMASLGVADGSVDAAFKPWSQYNQAPFPILNVTADSRGLYAGGGGSGGHLVLWNLDGSLQQPVYQTDGGVQSVSVAGATLYVGGHFTNYCVGNTGAGRPFLCTNPLSRRKAFEVSLSTGNLTSWAPRFNSPHGVIASAVDPATGSLWMAGDFTKVGTKAVDHLAHFDS
jgi:hypothetical protein